MGKLIFKYSAVLWCVSTASTAFAQTEEPADALATDSVMAMSLSAAASEVNSSVRPEQLYKTPEAKAFQEYGRFGSEASNGSVDISIPIHTVSCRDLQIPISLHYGGKGIQVAEEASWVGLGWDLSVGGCINYVPAGQYDFLVRNAQWSDYLNVLNKNSQSTFQFQADMKDYPVMEDLVNGMGERDFYSVSLMGRGFMFFLNPYDGKPSLIGADDADYSITPLGVVDYVNSPSKITGWLIKDTMGFEYEFSATEYSTYEGQGKQKSAWYLSSIETPQGITAVFSYDTLNVKGLPQAYQWYDAQRGGFTLVNSDGMSFSYDVPRFGSGVSYSNVEIVKPILKSITTENQTVKFETSKRTDFEGSKKLDRIRIFNVLGSETGHFHFNYSTFAHSKVGGSCPNIINHLVSDPRNYERLKLESLSQISTDGLDSLTHVFAYNEKHPLPLKTSAAIDFWGFYNGKENMTANSEITDSRSLIPSLQDCTIGYTPPIALTPTALSKKGACRFSDPNYILSGTLSSITYPTGGRTEFTFEPHRFNSSPAYPLYNIGYSNINAEAEDLNYPATSTNPGPVSNKRIDLSGNARGFLTVIFEARSGKKLRDLKTANASVTIQPMAAPSYRKLMVSLDSCSNVNLESTYHKQVFAVSLEAISYILIANLPANLAYGEGWVHASLELKVLDQNLESGGAGLRIAAIDNFDDDGSLTGRREYEYLCTDGSTSGQLIVRGRPTECRVKYLEHTLSREHFDVFKTHLNAAFSVIKIGSSLYGGPAITGMMSSGPVGYSRIVEKERSGNGTLLRTTVRDYQVETSVEPVPDMHLISRYGGGEILKKSVYDASGQVVSTEDFNYAEMSNRSMKSNISIEDQYYEYVNEGWDSKHQAPRYLLRIYPYVSYWRVPTSVKTKEYTPAGTKEILQQYTYNTANRLIASETLTSGGVGTRTDYKYSVDYPTASGYSTMITDAYHMRGIPVETTTYDLRNGAYKESGRERLMYLFRKDKAAMLQVANVDASVAGSTLQTREAFTYSSEDDTLVGVVTDTSDKRSYLWSYSHTCPVAVIEGATYAEVESWVGTTLISNLSKAKTGVETLLSQLRTALKDKDVMVTTYTHKPLVGIATETRPDGTKLTYEYDAFNRLKRVIDPNGKTVGTYTYTYR